MKTKEELNDIKNEVESMNKKLSELTDDELNEVVGGMKVFIDDESDMGWWKMVLKLIFKIKS